MKILSLVSLMVLTVTVLSQPARGDEPDAAQIAKLTPQLQAMLNELLKAADGDATDPAPAAPTAPPPATPAHLSVSTAPATPSLTSPASGSRSPRTALGSTMLQTSSLRTGHLGSSTSLSGAPRWNDDEWRQIFPQKK